MTEQNKLNHYYFKNGIQNQLFEKYLKAAGQKFKEGDTVPLSIYFGKWKLNDNNKDDESYKEDSTYKRDVVNKKGNDKQVKTFLEIGYNKGKLSVFWIFHKGFVYALMPKGKIKNGASHDEDKNKSFPKTISCTIKKIFDKNNLPENFATINANQEYNRKTIQIFKPNILKIANTLLIAEDDGKIKITEKEKYNFLSPIQFETLIFLIFHHNNIFCSTYRGGTLEGIDLKINIPKKVSIEGIDRQGKVNIQVKMKDCIEVYPKKKRIANSNNNEYLIHLGETQIDNCILGRDWIDRQVNNNQIIKKWLRQSLSFYGISL